MLKIHNPIDFIQVAPAGLEPSISTLKGSRAKPLHYGAILFWRNHRSATRVEESSEEELPPLRLLIVSLPLRRYFD